jgi:hypothetical protein
MEHDRNQGVTRSSRCGGKMPKRIRSCRALPNLEPLETRYAPATFNVNSTADLFAPPPGIVTLRSAVEAANLNPGGNTINLTIAGTYRITLVGAGEDNNATGDFDILPSGGDLTIINTSGGTVIVDGNQLDRVFDINSGNTDNPATKISVTFQGFTIENGIAFDPANPDGPTSSGGGIRDQGNASLTLNNMVITNNFATADGGGVAMENAPGSTPWTLTLKNTTISNNHAGDAGGGVETDGKGQVNINAGSVLTGNTTVNQGAAVWLDAIANAVDTVTVTNGGTGYASAPMVTFIGGGGSGATGIATIANGMVTTVTLTNSGTGYTSAPMVTFIGGGGSGAAATATVVANQSASLVVTGALVSNNAALNGPTGAIGNAGNGAVTIVSSTVANNFSGTTGGGFGDENNLGTLSVMNSLFLNNSALGNGGGIQEGGPTATISNTEIRGNSSGGSGGGLFVDGTTLTVLSSTFFDNTASGNGGGIELETTGTGMAGSTITNATITGNSALNSGGGHLGGGIDAPATFTGSLVLLNDTINANFATAGGGVFWAATGGSIFGVRSTIIAKNMASTGPDANNPAGTFTDNGGNLIGISGIGSGNTGFTAASTQTGTVANPLNPLLGVVQNNGGPTLGAPGNTGPLETASPLPGSPAIDKGVNGGAPANDERGFNRIVNTTVDVGADEFQPPATMTVLISPVNPGTVGQNVALQATVAGTAPGSNTPTGTVSFLDGGRTLATVPLASGIATLNTTTLTPGTHRITAVYNGLTVGDFSFSTSMSAPVSEFIRGGLFAIGGAPGRVQLRRDSDGTLVLDFAPYPAPYAGPVSVALGDINGDGFPDLVTSATVGNPDVRVFDGRALAQGTVSLLTQFFAYGLNFNVGANVAVGDISGNGFADLVTGATVGNPDVRVFNGEDIAMGSFNPTGSSLLAQFFPYALQFNVGANVAVGDVNGDGFADLVTGATVGNPDVRVYNGKDIANKVFHPNGSSLLAQFFAFGLNFNIGAFVAVADTNGDGFGDVIAGASAGNPQVKVYDGQAIAQGTFNPTTSLLNQFFAYDRPGANVGVSVGAADFEGTGMADILTGPTQGPANYRVVRGNATGTLPPAVNGIDAVAADITGGLLVGA